MSPLWIVSLGFLAAAACEERQDAPPEKSADPASTTAASTHPAATPSTSAAGAPPSSVPPPPVQHSAHSAPAPSSSASATPMARWMRDVVTPPFLAGDLAASGATFDQMAAMRMPDMANWVSISRDGAAAVRAGELDAAKAACRGCHAQYVAEYRAKHAADPAP